MNNWESSTKAVWDSRGIFINNAQEGHFFSSLSVAALAYERRYTKGEPFDSQTLSRLNRLQRLCINLNDHFDEGKLDTYQYTDNVSDLIFSPDKQVDALAWGIFTDFQTNLERVEVDRPTPGTGEPYQRFINYRESSNRLHLQGLYALGCGSREFMQITDIHEMPATFRNLFENVMAMQVYDDLIGAPGDIIHKRPSFVSGYLKQCDLETYQENEDEIYPKLQVTFAEYRERARQSEPNFDWPISIGVSLAPTFASMSRLSKQKGLRVPGLSTGRDFYNK